MLQHAGVVVSHNINNCVKYAHAYFFIVCFDFFLPQKCRKSTTDLETLFANLYLLKFSVRVGQRHRFGDIFVFTC